MKKLIFGILLSLAVVTGLSAMECPGKEKRSEIHCPGDKK